MKALPAGLTDVLAVGALVVFGRTFGVASEDISTAATMLLAIVGFLILFKICQPMNVIRGGVWVISIVGLIGCSIFLRIFLPSQECPLSVSCCLWYFLLPRSRCCAILPCWWAACAACSRRFSTEKRRRKQAYTVL